MEYEIDIESVVKRNTQQILSKINDISHYVYCSDNLADILNIFYAKEFGLTKFKRLICLRVCLGADGGSSVGVLSEIDNIDPSLIWSIAVKVMLEKGFIVSGTGQITDNTK